jgi:hypothetical protein
MQLPAGHATETPANPEEVLSFLSNVVGLDMSKYSVMLSGISVDYPHWLGSLPETTGKYSIVSESSSAEVIFSFVGSTLHSCFIDVLRGSIQYDQPPSSNLYTAGTSFIQKYKEFTGRSNIDPFVTIMDKANVNSNSNLTVSSENVCLNIVVREDNFSSFDWKFVLNGAAYSGIFLSFYNGAFDGFGDDTSYLKIGNSEINISREKAVSIALDFAKNFSYTAGTDTIRNFSIAQERISSGLYTQAKDKPLELYPYWVVTLPLNDVYPGFVYYIEVRIWADRGAIIDGYPLGYGGDETLTESHNTPQPSIEPETLPSQIEITITTPTSLLQPSQVSSSKPRDETSPAIDLNSFYVTATVAALVAAISIVVLLKKRKHPVTRIF